MGGIVADDSLNRGSTLEKDDTPEVIDGNFGRLDFELIFDHLRGTAVGEVPDGFLRSVLDLKKRLEFYHLPVLREELIKESVEERR
jgi:hypothetical protein